MTEEQVVNGLREQFGAEFTSADVRAFGAMNEIGYTTVTRKIEKYKVGRGRWNLEEGEQSKSLSEGTEDDSAYAAASSFFEKKRPLSGPDAFADTTWSVMLQLDEGGSTIFSVQLLDDFSCRFSDSNELGEWECEKEWFVIEKPKGFFDNTLFLSGKLSPPTVKTPIWRLVEGIVHQTNETTSMPGNATEDPVEVVKIGTFGANEFDEPLLTHYPRNQQEELDLDDLESLQYSD
jgi:hypothetical protein